MTTVLICLTDWDLWAQKNVHFLCLEPCEADKSVLKLSWYLLINLVLKFHMLLLGARKMRVWRNRGRVVQYWPLTKSFLLLGFLRLCQCWFKLIKKCDHESARRWTHWLTDANWFYNLSHAICYSYGADNKGITLFTCHHTKTAPIGTCVQCSVVMF